MSRRRALVVGINTYPGFGPESQLVGAVRDARALAEMLIERYRFPPEHVSALVDEQATRAGILEALAKLREGLRSDDHLVVFFSGHGSRMTDREGDEGDGLDETLVPFDSGRLDGENRDITDDEINDWAAGALEVTPHVTLIFDCCHSATMHRPGWKVRSVPPDLRPVEELPPSPILVWRDVETGPRPLIVAACLDDERAYELPRSASREARGALSLHLTEALRAARSEMTWREIFDQTAARLALEHLDQHPQISGDGLDFPIFAESRSATRGLDPETRLLSLADRPDPYGLTLELYRSRGGAWRRAHDAAFVVGDRLRLDLKHQHNRAIFIYLLDIGLTGTVTLLFPDFDGHEVLDPRTTLTVGARRGDALELYFPRGLPPDQSDGCGHLLLIGSSFRLSTARLLVGSVVELEKDGAPVSAAVVKKYQLRRE